MFFYRFLSNLQKDDIGRYRAPVCFRDYLMQMELIKHEKSN